MVSIWKLHLKVSLVYHVYHYTDIFRWTCHTYGQCSFHCKDIGNFLHRTGNILKIIVFGNRSLATSCSWNRISSKIMKYLDKCITCCTSMTPPTCLTGTHTICVPTSFAIWWTGQGTVFTVISQLALLSKDNINNQRVYLKCRLSNFFSFFI